MIISTVVDVACLLTFVTGGGVEVVVEPTGGTVTWATPMLVIERVMLMGGPA